MPVPYPPNSGVPLRNDTVPGDGTGDVIRAEHVQSIIDVLGPDPKGASGTLTERLVAIDNRVTSIFGSNVVVLGVSEAIPTNYPAGTIILRRIS
jgi:hypothetical protein